MPTDELKLPKVFEGRSVYASAGPDKGWVEVREVTGGVQVSIRNGTPVVLSKSEATRLATHLDTVASACDQ